jgi:hypothetical protein
MFKVGDRVWSYRYNKYMWVNEVTSSGCFLADDEKLLINYYHSNCEFHQTADDMFEELGYRTVSEDSSYIIYNYHNYEDGYITELRIDKEKNKYKLTNFTNNNQAFSAWGDKLLHLAIHQKMIELGWIE